MIGRNSKRDLDKELRESQQEHRQVVRAGREREPMLKRLERALQDNYIAERLVAGMESTRRRPT